MYIYTYIECIYIYILRHLRIVSLEFLKQHFDGCLFQVSFYLCNFFIIYTIYFIKVYTYYTLQFSLEAS